MAASGRRRQVAADPHEDFAVAVSVTRFWSLVARGAPNECWLWLGDFDGDGYGVFCFRGRKYGAHELALLFASGERRLPKLDTCHSCDTPSCVNPAHLRFDTRAGNVADMWARRRANPAVKLTPEEIVLMRERRASGARQKDLARDFRVSDSYVSVIVRGVRRQDVGGPIQPKGKRIYV